MPAASVPAFQRDVMIGDRAAEQAKREPRGLLRAPGHADRAAGSEATGAAGRPTGAGSPTRRAAPSEATAAFVRRLRRAGHPAGRSGGPGLISAGADVNAVQRSGTE